jgi:hypothetical protein
MMTYQPRYRSSHAIVIGINSYSHVAPLSYAKADAEAFAGVLTATCGFPAENVQLLLDNEASAAAIRRAFLGLGQCGTLPDDRVVFFFAGHGMTLRGRRGEVGYLIPADGNPGDISSLIRWDDLTRNADLVPAKHLLFIMDACYGGLALTRTIAPGSSRFLRDMLLRPSRQVLTAGKADETVSDSGGSRAGHSVFTGHLLDAIEGPRTQAGGVLTASAVMAYVYDRVATDANSKQTPHYGHVDGDGDLIFVAPNLTDELEPSVIDTDILVAVPATLRPPTLGSRAQLVDEVKELVSEPRHRIRLDDVTTDRIRAALAECDPSRFDFSEPINAETITKRVALYDQAVSDLAVVVVLLGRWATPEQSTLLSRVFSRLADVNTSIGGFTAWINLRWYPLLVLHYYAGIAALANDNWVVLGRVFATTFADATSGEPTRVISRANAAIADCHDMFKLMPGREHQFTPRSEMMFKGLQPLLDDLAFLGSSYESLFDRFEVLNALVYADARGEIFGRWWGPPGRYWWKLREGVGGNPLKILEEEAARDGEDWPPLRHGLFHGSAERFALVLTGVKTSLLSQ